MNTIHSSSLVSCRKCGYNFPDVVASNIETRTPCPTCGTRSIAISVQFHSIAKAQTSIKHELALSHIQKNWKLRWSFLKQNLSELCNPINGMISGERIQAAAHALNNFYVEAYNFKDSLKNESNAIGVTRQDIEIQIDADPRLALLADLANKEKHTKLNTFRSGFDPVTTDISALSDALTGGWHLQVKICHGPKIVDGIQAAKDGLLAWEQALKAWGAI